LHHHGITDMTHDELKVYLDAARAEARASAAAMAASQAQCLADVKAGLATISAGIADLRSDIHTTFATQNRWIVAMGLGVIACTAAASGIFKSPDLPVPPAPAPSPVPLVIYVQPFAPMSHQTLPPTPALSPDSKGRD
jgi:hypothetical protein